MATPSELSLEEIRKYLLENGGTARNHDVVKHFKRFLTDPETRVEARNRFKEYVNTLAAIKNEEGEKYLVLKKKYRQNLVELSTPEQCSSPIGTPDISTPVSPLRVPPPYRPPPPAPLSPPANNTNTHREESCSNFVREEAAINARKNGVDRVETGFSTSSPPVPPRRKSQDKIKIENKENVDRNRGGSEAVIKEDEAVATNPGSTEQLSFRERMQRFNRMASETDLQGRPNGTITPTKKRSDKGADEDDSASVASQLDGKSREWLVRAAQGDYQALAKLAAEEPRLTRLKDPTSTALHWAAKHGDENIVKLIAGKYKNYIKSINETSNGGYTPLHIAMQFDHENIFNLLVQVYGANQEVRDYSGKKARQYLVSQEAAVSQDTFRKIKARKKHAEKDLGFLRIGSLNVRVKRTTEAFSQFLGVATSSASSNHEKIHKSWGSADNVQLEQKMMPPPKYAPIKKRRSRRAQDFGSSRDHQAASQPNTPLLQGKVSRSSQSMHRRPTSTTAVSSAAPKMQQSNDSDSDTACGFDSAWRGSAQL
ncbi:PREDICTED: ankyrin repeat domain-containing protein SOWAHB isoform X3 [Eufriesea mexicana]|uniref:ankyrin repeat domain-containing protein SOWAHB isoform X3 n=1 Tax=Eufriesea mexicana TaxID=516756 RepID=UPI00083C87DD|nr:PREDICTED: ankyrin repeat domain-containing protein SOWAHB isoform X3 [Eufriesea mexicana]